MFSMFMLHDDNNVADNSVLLVFGAFLFRDNKAAGSEYLFGDQPGSWCHTGFPRQKYPTGFFNSILDYCRK